MAAVSESMSESYGLYTSLAADRYVDWLKLKKAPAAADVFVRVELPGRLAEQWEEYLRRAAKIGRPAVLYRYAKSGNPVGSGPVPVDEALGAYVREVAQPRYHKTKKDGYRSVVVACRSKFGIRGLGDQVTGDVVKGVEDEYWISLAFYREAHQLRWVEAKLGISYGVDGFEGAWESGKNTKSDFASATRQIVCFSDLLLTYIELAKERRARGDTAPGPTASMAAAAEAKPSDIKEDTFEDLQVLYSGKPDELYRRKSSKKFACYKRKRAEMERREQDRHVRAESEMLRRRQKEGDKVRSHRDSLNQFRFCNGKNTFAYCTKLPEIGRIKEGMLQKYSTVENDAEEPTAEEILVTKPSFNTKVMNRFG